MKKKLLLVSTCFALGAGVASAQSRVTGTVTDPDGQETAYEIHTDAETGGDALESLDLIAGEEGDYGLFVTTVDGVSLPSDGDQYWAFYIDGAYATSGVDQTEITAGASYALKAESM